MFGLLWFDSRADAGAEHIGIHLGPFFKKAPAVTTQSFAPLQLSGKGSSGGRCEKVLPPLAHQHVSTSPGTRTNPGARGYRCHGYTRVPEMPGSRVSDLFSRPGAIDRLLQSHRSGTVNRIQTRRNRPIIVRTRCLPVSGDRAGYFGLGLAQLQAQIRFKIGDFRPDP